MIVYTPLAPQDRGENKQKPLLAGWPARSLMRMHLLWVILQRANGRPTLLMNFFTLNYTLRIGSFFAPQICKTKQKTLEKE